VGQFPGEGDRGAEDRADRGGAGAVEEGAGAVVAAYLVEAGTAEQDEQEGRGEGAGVRPG
jgi:hypothetical protein